MCSDTRAMDRSGHVLCMHYRLFLHLSPSVPFFWVAIIWVHPMASSNYSPEEPMSSLQRPLSLPCTRPQCSLELQSFLWGHCFKELGVCIMAASLGWFPGPPSLPLTAEGCRSARCRSGKSWRFGRCLWSPQRAMPGIMGLQGQKGHMGWRQA